MSAASNIWGEPSRIRVKQEIGEAFKKNAPTVKKVADVSVDFSVPVSVGVVAGLAIGAAAAGGASPLVAPIVIGLAPVATVYSKKIAVASCNGTIDCALPVAQSALERSVDCYFDVGGYLDARFAARNVTPIPSARREQ